MTDRPYEDVNKYGKRYGKNDYRQRDAYKKEDDDENLAAKTPKIDYDSKRQKPDVSIVQRAVQSVQNDPIKPLRLVSSEVIGGIFDRVIFLEKRISELQSNIEVRKKIHESIEKEIEKDIDDRNQFIQIVSDINEKRNLKLDISVLRKERRNENVQFWRDLVELDTELKKLQEEFEIETKIAGLFKKSENPN